MDCGASSLAIVCRYYGKAISLARIRQLVHTGLDGASLKAICEGANELGLAARAVKASPAGLDQMPLPAIVHWDGNHWVVLYDVDDSHVKISDPAVGKRRMTRDEFEREVERLRGALRLYRSLRRQSRGAGRVSPGSSRSSSRTRACCSRPRRSR